MAILKHLPSHNRFYQDAVNYFLFQHDDHARPIYNAQHKMILRENVLIDAINERMHSSISPAKHNPTGMVYAGETGEIFLALKGGNGGEKAPQNLTLKR